MKKTIRDIKRVIRNVRRGLFTAEQAVNEIEDAIDQAEFESRPSIMVGTEEYEAIKKALETFNGILRKIEEDRFDEIEKYNANRTMHRQTNKNRKEK